MDSNPYSAPVSPLDSPRGSEFGHDAVAAGVIEQLAKTKPWVRLMSVLLFIGSGFLLLIGLIMLVGGGAGMVAGGSFGAAEIGLGIGIAVFYLVLAILYVYPALKLWKYASRIGLLVNSSNPGDLEMALNEQRAFWKFVGIVAVIMLALYLIAIPIAVIFSFNAAR